LYPIAQDAGGLDADGGRRVFQTAIETTFTASIAIARE
jgi:hypothetical protein